MYFCDFATKESRERERQTYTTKHVEFLLLQIYMCYMQEINDKMRRENDFFIYLELSKMR